jgi:hypothetical protein
MILKVIWYLLVQVSSRLNANLKLNALGEAIRVLPAIQRRTEGKQRFDAGRHGPARREWQPQPE